MNSRGVSQNNYIGYCIIKNFQVKRDKGIVPDI